LTGQILQLNLPTLVLWGSEDRLIPPDHGRRFHRDISGIQIEVFEGMGHVPHEISK
jgi:pimeloyl-ACP methyl ester carboxylesterase